MDNIAKIERLVKNKKQKNSKIIAFLCEQYAIRGEGTFFKSGELWINASCRDLEDKLNISHSMVNKTLNFLKRENLIKYSYVNNAGYERTRKEEQMCVHFTPKGIKLLVKPLTEHLKPREEKKVDTTTKETNRNNLYIYKSSNEDVFKKFNNSLVAKAWYELRQRGYLEQITAGKSRYLHAALKFIGSDCDSYEKISRFRNYLNWVEDTLGKISLHRLLNFKLFRNYFANLTRVLPLDLPQRNALKYEPSTEYLPKTFRNNFEIISNNSLESVQSILENLEFLRFNTVV